MKPVLPASAHSTSDAHAIAGAIVSITLEGAGARLGCDKVQVVKRLNDGDMGARREIKLGLAQYLAEYLGFLDEDVKAVYVSDHVDNYRAESAEKLYPWNVQLVVYADPKTAALTLLLSALKRALARALRESVEVGGTEDFLDIQTVNRADLENLARYAALLTAPGNGTTRVWQREPPESNREQRNEPLRQAQSRKQKVLC